MPNTKIEIQTIEQLTDRFRGLDTKKTRVQALMDATRERLEELLVDAEKQFGTRDLDELQAQLKQLDSENQKKRQLYQKELDTIEQKLAEIDEQFCDLEIESDGE